MQTPETLKRRRLAPSREDDKSQSITNLHKMLEELEYLNDDAKGQSPMKPMRDLNHMEMIEDLNQISEIRVTERSMTP